MKPREVISSAIRATVSMLLELDRRVRSATRSPTTARMVPPVADGRCRGLPVLDDLESVVELVKERPGLFLRYSEGPAADIGAVSRDYEADVALPGLSVTTIAPEPWWPRPTEDWVARRICKYDELGVQNGRFPWLLSGRQVATGPDHEPIVELDEPIAVLTPRTLRQARRCYRRRFEIGQDSAE